MGRLQSRDKSEDLPVIVKSVLSGIRAKLPLENEVYLLLALVFNVCCYADGVFNLNTRKMIKKCAKCKAEFNCRHDEILECHCVQVPISAKAQKYLTENFKDCLCNKCLREVAEKFNVKTNKSEIL